MSARLARPLAALGIVAVAIVLFLLLGGSDDRYVVKVEFADAGGVTKNSDVKIGEVPAGTVTKIDLTDGDRAIVTMRLDDDESIGAGASARSRPANLLGEKYIDLDPGDLSRPQPSGTTVPASRTATAVELDDVLNALDPATRARLRILVNEGGVALAGRGADFNGLLEQLPESLDQATAFVGSLSRDAAALDRLVERGDRVLAALGPRREQLGDLVDSADAALATTAEHRAALGRTLASAPGGLRQLRRTLGVLRQTGDQLRPAAASLRTAAAPLATTLQRLPGFAGDARQTLTAARQASPALSRLGTQGTPPVRRLRPTLDHLDRVVKGLDPTIATLDKSAMADALRFTNNWANITERSDGLGHVFRVRLFVSPETVTGLHLPRPGINDQLDTETPRKQPATRPPARPGRPAQPQGGKQPSAPAAPSPQPTAPPAPPEPKSARTLLDFLLGR